MDEAFEPLRGGHGLVRELPGVRVWSVDDGPAGARWERIEQGVGAGPW